MQNAAFNININTKTQRYRDFSFPLCLCNSVLNLYMEVLCSIVLMASMAGCGRHHPANGNPAPVSKEEIHQEAVLQTDSFKYALKTANGSCEVYIDYPKSGPKAADIHQLHPLRERLRYHRRRPVGMGAPILHHPPAASRQDPLRDGSATGERGVCPRRGNRHPPDLPLRPICHL